MQLFLLPILEKMPSTDLRYCLKMYSMTYSNLLLHYLLEHYLEMQVEGEDTKCNQSEYCNFTTNDLVHINSLTPPTKKVNGRPDG